jgi:hypothetical protein
MEIEKQSGQTVVGSEPRVRTQCTLFTYISTYSREENLNQRDELPI